MAWTITASIDQAYNTRHSMGDEMIIVKFDCTSDSSGTDTDLDSVLTSMEWESIKGGWVYGILVEPGTGGEAPTAAFNIDIQNSTNFSLLDKNSVSETAPSWITGDDTIGQFFVIEDTCTLVCSTLGDANTATFYIYVLKG